MLKGVNFSYLNIQILSLILLGDRGNKGDQGPMGLPGPMVSTS